MAVQVGIHQAKISDYGVKETSTGKTYIEVWFDVEGQGSTRWNGWLSDKAIENTIKTLARLGLKGDLNSIADGPIGGALDMKREFEIEVEQQKDKDNQPTKYTQVKFIRGGQKFDQAARVQGKSKLAEFEGKWAMMRSNLGVKKEEPTVDPGF